MLQGREKVGLDVASGDIGGGIRAPSKIRRLAVTLTNPPTTTTGGTAAGSAHEHYIREIPLGRGGLGCALWDGGLVLSRWVYRHGSIFSNCSVVELGCGVGLAGIVAAHWASTVTLTDYIPELVANAVYNSRLNSSSSECEDDNDKELQLVSGAQFHTCIANRVFGYVLDWDAFAEEQLDGAPVVEGSRRRAVCTRHVKEGLYFEQEWYRCEQCWPDDPSRGCCVSCAQMCHVGHTGLLLQPAARFRCDLHDHCRAQPPPPFALHSVDIIIGSELTYNTLSCESLAAVVDGILSPNGVFYEVLSDDRDGVGLFAQFMQRRGFHLVKRPAPIEFCENFETRPWKEQKRETYSFYTWRRVDCTAHRFPDME